MSEFIADNGRSMDVGRPCISDVDHLNDTAASREPWPSDRSPEIGVPSRVLEHASFKGSSLQIANV